ncbi:MAG TPA: hypothetical protein VF714_00380, partial [Jatrophihabitans sp.]
MAMALPGPGAEAIVPPSETTVMGAASLLVTDISCSPGTGQTRHRRAVKIHDVDYVMSGVGVLDKAMYLLDIVE